MEPLDGSDPTIAKAGNGANFRLVAARPCDYFHKLVFGRFAITLSD
jgi:hypothetical protein